MTEASAAEPTPSPVLVEIWRGDVLESLHRGRAVICRPDGTVEAAWGDIARPVLPRSAVKPLQALALVESGAADRAGLGPEHLALACASHFGTEAHAGRVRRWLDDLGLGVAALRCGAHAPKDKASRVALARAGIAPDQANNQCSGKHAGMLTLGRDLGAGPEYIETDHPVQRQIHAALEEVSGEATSGHGIDGCSAPNFALSLKALATAMARFATAGQSLAGARATAAVRLREAMAAHPDLVACDGDPVTELMRASLPGTAIKSGAEGSYLAMLPDAGLGIALKIDDGSERAADAAIAALLVRTAALDRAHPRHAWLTDAPILNWRRIDCGRLRAAATLYA